VACFLLLLPFVRLAPATLLLLCTCAVDGTGGPSSDKAAPGAYELVLANELELAQIADFAESVAELRAQDPIGGTRYALGGDIGAASEALGYAMVLRIGVATLRGERVVAVLGPVGLAATLRAQRQPSEPQPPESDSDSNGYSGISEGMGWAIQMYAAYALLLLHDLGFLQGTPESDGVLDGIADVLRHESAGANVTDLDIERIKKELELLDTGTEAKGWSLVTNGDFPEDCDMVSGLGKVIVKLAPLLGTTFMHSTGYLTEFVPLFACHSESLGRVVSLPQCISAPSGRALVVALSVNGPRPITFTLEGMGEPKARHVAPGAIRFLPLIGPELDAESSITMDSAVGTPARAPVLLQTYTPRDHVIVPDACAEGFVLDDYLLAAIQ